LAHEATLRRDDRRDDLVPSGDGVLDKGGRESGGGVASLVRGAARPARAAAKARAALAASKVLGPFDSHQKYQKWTG
jgi:hypothetical protein